LKTEGYWKTRYFRKVFSSINKSVGAIKKPSKIHILPGHYGEGVEINSIPYRIEISPDKNNRVTPNTEQGGVLIDWFGSGPVLHVINSNVAVDNITLNHSKRIPAIVVEGGSLELTNCVISSPIFGLFVKNARIVVRNCVFKKCKRGIQVTRGQGEIIGNTFVNNGMDVELLEHNNILSKDNLNVRQK